MSGDCKDQPIIFHSNELTPTKVALLQLYCEEVITVHHTEFIMKRDELPN